MRWVSTSSRGRSGVGCFARWVSVLAPQGRSSRWRRARPKDRATTSHAPTSRALCNADQRRATSTLIAATALRVMEQRPLEEYASGIAPASDTGGAKGAHRHRACRKSAGASTPAQPCSKPPWSCVASRAASLRKICPTPWIRTSIAAHGHGRQSGTHAPPDNFKKTGEQNDIVRSRGYAAAVALFPAPSSLASGADRHAGKFGLLAARAMPLRLSLPEIRAPRAKMALKACRRESVQKAWRAASPNLPSATPSGGCGVCSDTGALDRGVQSTHGCAKPGASDDACGGDEGARQGVRQDRL